MISVTALLVLAGATGSFAVVCKHQDFPDNAISSAEMLEALVDKKEINIADSFQEPIEKEGFCCAKVTLTSAVFDAIFDKKTPLNPKVLDFLKDVVTFDGLVISRSLSKEECGQGPAPTAECAMAPLPADLFKGAHAVLGCQCHQDLCN